MGDEKEAEDLKSSKSVDNRVSTNLKVPWISPYTTHVGPYYTYDEALKVESICAAISSNDDSEAISNNVTNVLQSKKRIIKATQFYADSEVQPPKKHVARESKKQLSGKVLSNSEVIPPADYVMRSNSQHETHNPNLVQHEEPFLSNQGDGSNPDNEVGKLPNNQQSPEFSEKKK